jgi:hypothetical protein
MLYFDVDLDAEPRQLSSIFKSQTYKICRYRYQLLVYLQIRQSSH